MSEEIGKIKINQLQPKPNENLTETDVFPLYHKPDDSSPLSGTYKISLGELKNTLFGGGSGQSGVPMSVLSGVLPIEKGGTGSSEKTFLKNTTDTFTGTLTIIPPSSALNSSGLNVTGGGSTATVRVKATSLTGSIGLYANSNEGRVGLYDYTNDKIILSKDVVNSGSILGAATTFHGTATSAIVASTASVASTAGVATSAVVVSAASTSDYAARAGELINILPVDKGGTGASTKASAVQKLMDSNITGFSHVLGTKSDWSQSGSISLQSLRNAMGLGDTTGVLPLANGGTGGNSRLNGIKNLINENVGTSANYFVTGNYSSSAWQKIGYCTAAQARYAMGLGNTTGVLGTAYGGTGVTTGKAPTAGTADAAAKLSTARTIRTNLASTGTASFNGTANITPGVQGILPIANGGNGHNTNQTYYNYSDFGVGVSKAIANAANGASLMVVISGSSATVASTIIPISGISQNAWNPYVNCLGQCIRVYRSGANCTVHLASGSGWIAQVHFIY